MTDAPPPARDYRDTVFLPKTDFPMKAGLPQKEPQILARWEEQGLYRELRAAREGREKFILHDGPPYANGDMHIGHALNRILKDMVVRSQSLLGKPDMTDDEITDWATEAAVASLTFACATVVVSSPAHGAAARISAGTIAVQSRPMAR